MGGAGLNSNVINSVRSGGVSGGGGGVFGAPGSVYGISSSKEDNRKNLDQIFGKVGGDNFVRNQGIARASGGSVYGYAPVNISAEEQKKFKDMVAEIVGGVAVSHIQAVQPLQPQKAPNIAVQQDSHQISQVYHQALEQLKSLQQQEQIIQQRINLLSTLVEHYGSEPLTTSVPFYLIVAILIVLVVLVVLFAKMKIYRI